MIKTLFGFFALLLTLSATSTSAETPLPTITQGKGEQCVEPTDVMRRNHMEFLMHKRDETMHHGIRTKKYSLKDCIDCHAQKDSDGHFIPVTEEGQFCESCHEYAAVTIDCFQCHATKPEE